MSDTPESNGRATLKDVYELVDNTRKEMNANIEGLGTKFDQFVTSNEHRLTVVETHQSTQAQQLTEVIGRLDNHGGEIGNLKDQIQQDQAADKALSLASVKRTTMRQWLIGSAIGSVGTAALLLSILHL